MLFRINVLLSCLLVLVVALLAFSRVDNTRPNYQVTLGDDMTYGPAYTSYSANSNFPNGLTIQPPVPGTIARGMQVFHFAATPQDALRAGEELSNPIELESESGAASVARGAATYQTFCVSCHAADGNGNGLVAQRGYPPPPSLLTGKSREMKDGQLFHILTYGQNSMPEFAAQLSPAKRWDVINHLRKLQQAVPPINDPATEEATAAATEETAAEQTSTTEEPAQETTAEQAPAEESSEADTESEESPTANAAEETQS